MVRYQKYDYIEKQNQHKPYIYRLTAWGVENQKNPYMARDEQKRRYKEFQMGIVGALLNESPETLSQLVSQLSGQNIGGYGVGGSYGGSDVRNSSDFGDSGDYHKKDLKIDELESKIKELEQENEELDKENTDLTLELSKQNKPTMVINQAPQPQQEPEQEPQPQDTNERSFDGLLWEYKDRMIDYSAYRKLPKQIVKLIAFPKGNISESIRNLLQGKKKGGYITVPSNTVSTMVNYGFVGPLRKEEIELLMMRFINGKVVLISPSGMGFEICEVPKSARPQPQQSKVQPQHKQRVRINANNNHE
jgi:hypothetical protein